MTTASPRIQSRKGNRFTSEIACAYAVQFSTNCRGDGAAYASAVSGGAAKSKEKPRSLSAPQADGPRREAD